MILIMNTCRLIIELEVKLFKREIFTKFKYGTTASLDGICERTGNRNKHDLVYGFVEPGT